MKNKPHISESDMTETEMWEGAWTAYAARAEHLRKWKARNCVAYWYTDCDGDQYWIVRFEKDTLNPNIKFYC
jgi:hypothetical protein